MNAILVQGSNHTIFKTLYIRSGSKTKPSKVYHWVKNDLPGSVIRSLASAACFMDIDSLFFCARLWDLEVGCLPTLAKGIDARVLQR